MQPARKYIILILSFLWAIGHSHSQENDSTANKQNTTDTAGVIKKHASNSKPEMFTAGFIDIINGGQVNASARFIRLSIGEPGKFSLPLSIYCGVSANNFQNDNTLHSTNESLVVNLINPLTGMVNASIDGIAFFNKKSTRTTRFGINYHFGERILTGERNSETGNHIAEGPANFLNTVVATGLYFQTGAWERNKNENVGLAWFSFRLIGCYTNPKQLKELMPDIKPNGFYSGYSLAWGVEINDLLNIRIVYYRYLKKPELDYKLPIYQFSFNYSLEE